MKGADLKRTTKPYDSTIMPRMGHPIITKKKPTPNEIVPWTSRKIESVKRKITVQEDSFICQEFLWRVGEDLDLEVLPFHKELHGRLRSYSQRDSWYEENLIEREKGQLNGNPIKTRTTRTQWKTCHTTETRERNSHFPWQAVPCQKRRRSPEMRRRYQIQSSLARFLITTKKFEWHWWSKAQILTVKENLILTQRAMHVKSNTY